MDVTSYFPPEIVDRIFGFLDYHEIAGAMGVNKQWRDLVSGLIVDIFCAEFWSEKVSADHARINIRVEEDLDHSILNYRLHHLSTFSKLELRINYDQHLIIQDWPEHIGQLARLQNLINLELVELPTLPCQYNWSTLSVLTNLQRLFLDNRFNILYGIWLPLGLHSLELRWATLDSSIVETIARMPFLSELCLDYVAASNQLLDTLFNRLGRQLTRLMFRDRVAEEIFRTGDPIKQLERQGPSSWCNFALLTNIEALQLSSTPENGLELMSNLTQLTSLALQGNYYEDDSLYLALSFFTNLRSIEANLVNGTSSLVPFLHSITSLTKLAELTITNCSKMKDEDLKGFMPFTNLTCLALLNLKLTAACFEFLRPLTNLQQLKLWDTSIWQGYEPKSNVQFSVVDWKNLLNK